jgi:hypothetical protein
MKNKGTVISLCDITGHMVAPWVKAGYRAVLVDPQHPETTDDGRILRISDTVLGAGRLLSKVLKEENVVFVSGFPPCTDVAVSGARHFEAKRLKDPHFQAKAALVAEQCRMVGELSGAPWMFENPVSVFSGIFGKAQYSFHPHFYTQLCAEDNYTKNTQIWASPDFVMPEPCPDTTLGKPDNRIHAAPPGPNRANFRSATPAGFAMAVYLANAPHLKKKRRK